MSNESRMQAAIETVKAVPSVAVEAAKATPAVTGAVASSITLNGWVAIATLVYIAIQAFYLLRKWWREERNEGGWLEEGGEA